MRTMAVWKALPLAIAVCVVFPSGVGAQEISLEGHTFIERENPNFAVIDSASGSTFLLSTRPTASFFGTLTNSGFAIRVNNTDVIRLNTALRVGIGTVSPQEKLHVVGNIRVDGSFIDDGTTLNVPDYVFDDGYELMSLAELADFVAREKHLPNVPSATQVAERGVDLGEFQMRLLEKVEELTLYLLRQNEQLAVQQERIEGLEAELTSLRASN